MKHLYLADLAGLDEEEIRKHLAEEYSGDKSGFDYGSPTDADKADAVEKLAKYDILVAYEHVGSWGCDSSSFFILRNKETGAFAQVSGGHCSCYGFEGQLDIEEMPNEFYHKRFYASTGGYDNSGEEHIKMVKEWIAENIPQDPSANVA